MISATNNIRLQQWRYIGFLVQTYSITSTDTYYFKHPNMQYIGKVVAYQSLDWMDYWTRMFTPFLRMQNMWVELERPTDRPHFCIHTKDSGLAMQE